MFDYEWATVQHNVNCRLAQAVVVPDAIPAQRLDRYGRGKVHGYPGLKEEYYLADFEPDPDPRRAGPRPVGADCGGAHAARRSRCTVENPLCRRGARPDARRFGGRTLPRTAQQREELARDRVTQHTIDAPSRLALADLVVSAGGTMNREAVALGTPVWTTFEGRLGAVDERLIAEGRMNRLTDASTLPLEKRSAAATDRIRRDPQGWSTSCSRRPPSHFSRNVASSAANAAWSP